MRRIWCVLFVVVLGLMAAAQLSQANAGLRVDETATRLLFRSDQAEISLVINSSRGSVVKTRIKIELINELNRTVAGIEREANLKPGSNTIVFSLPLVPTGYVLWRRLRYQVAEDSSTPVGPRSVAGIISLSQICPDIFELQLIKPLTTSEGARCHFRVRAEHPVSFRPVEGVSLKAAIAFEGLRAPLTSSGVTDSQGFAVFDLDLPAGLKSDGEIKVTGTRDGLSVSVEDTLNVDRSMRISISTDKSIYQPGQMLHVRALVFNPSKRAVRASELTLKILDPEDTIVHRAALKTSRFGIASDDWPIPANVRLGDYDIKIDEDDSEERNTFTLRHRVRISRYELPNFKVNVKTNLGFYLPGQNAEVEVGADYLFGQPLTRAKVRVVRETDREWNYREQKWEISEEEKYEGELDQTGRFIVNIDLSKQHAGLSERDYERFKDITYAAYVTDLTTNRTEQRRVDLRVTRDPIHIYVIDDGYRARNEYLYVSTSYADGTPAACEVHISQDLSYEAAGVRINGLRHLRTVKTNRYGVARVSALAIASPEGKPAAARPSHYANLDLSARDSEGRYGHTSRSDQYSNSGAIRVETNKALYKPGESIEVQLTAPDHPSAVFIEIAQRWKVVYSQIISLVSGRGRLTLPYKPDFKDEVTIAAYGYGESGDLTIGNRTVLFPRNHDLKLDVSMSQPQYRPGEAATVNFQVHTGDGRATEGALGVTVIDRAVEERARTDGEFGGRYDFARDFRRMWGYDEEIAGVTLNNLNGLDLSEPISPELQLVAEILLLRRGYWLEERGTSVGSPEHEFGHVLAAQLKPVRNALDSRYARKKEYPTDAAMLTRELADFGLDFVAMRDPWGLPYLPKFSAWRDRDVLTLVSAGPDKRAGTRDDFTVAEMSWPYFRPLGEAIDLAVQAYHKRTNGFIRDRLSLKRELLHNAVNIDTLRDRWGKPYRFDFGISANFFTVEVKSGGNDRRFESKRIPSADDFTLWSSKIDYFAETRAKINGALGDYFSETSHFPQDETALKEALGRASIDWETLRDPWGNRYYATFKTESRYTDRVRIITFAQYLEEARRRTEITPVTQQISVVHLRSGGQDGKEGTSDDFEAGTLSRVVSEKRAQDLVPLPIVSSAILPGATGAIGGLIVDPSGAVITNATIKATDNRSALSYEGKSDDNGRYLLANVPAGRYEVRFNALGFASTVITDVPVNSSNVTELNVTLIVGARAEVVDVTAGEAPLVQTQVSELSVSRPAPIGTSLAIVKQSNLASTPRLREYFPETLVWQPSLETDSSGHARLNFKLADNITTWKMSVVASTEDGEIGIAEKEILAFQSFFVEHDPPRVLTEGDEIALPVVLRSYLDKTQTVDLEIKRAPWFTILGPERKRAEVGPGDSAREVFDLRAVASVEDGKQRVTATGSEASDAIEKPVTVHPDGQELTQTATQVFSDTASMAFTVPEAAIPGSSRAELKIYPNLMAHVVESIEGIMKRPYGCAEQTISSAYPSLLLLRALRSKEDEASVLGQKARRYVGAAYERLLNYRNEDGGFTYWGRGEGDPALSAYALRFLTDASEVTAVDEDVIKNTRDWLIKHQRLDGSWLPRYTTDADRLATASATAFISRVLASTSKEDGSDSPSAASALRRALKLLGQRIDEIDEPYLIASYALAAMNSGEQAGAVRAIGKLLQLAHDEGDGSYWKLEANAPFNGWGLAGRIEATALAVQAIASYDWTKTSPSPDRGSSTRSPEELINRGLLFLLRHEDREGVWHSTQATVNVLDSLITVLGKHEPAGANTNSPAEVFVNDKQVASIPMPPANRLAEPILADISRFISGGNNRIQIRRAAGAPQASTQVVESHYEHWPAMTGTAKPAPAAAGAMRLQVSFDKVEAKIGDEITCTVQTERVGFHGYGMMLAEIGLPPGADVDRASLERAIRESRGVDQYDVLPDRLIVYVWPQASGTSFQFKFRLRFGLAALTAASSVYDYYNPEARAVVAPTRFIVR